MKRALLLLLALAGAILIFFILKNPAIFHNADSMRGGIGWQPVIQYSLNGYFSWRGDPWVDTLSSFLAAPEDPNRYQLALLVILWCGTCLLFKISLQATAANAITFASVFAASLGFICGADTVVLGTLCWIPFLVLTLDCGRRNGDFSWLVIFTLFALHSMSTANHSLFLSFAAAFALAAALTTSGATSSHQSSRVSLSSRNRRIVHRGCLLLAAGAYILFLSTAQHAPFPSYPAGARLIPLDGIPGLARPLIGADTPIPVIDSAAVRAVAFRPALAIFLLTGVFFLYWRKRSLPTAQLFAGAACIALTAIWDSAATKSIATLGPLAATARMFPNCFLFPLATIAVAISVLFFACGLVSEYGRLRWISPAVTLAIFALALIEILTAQKLNALPAGMYREDFSPAAWERKADFVPGSAAIDWQRALESPSRFAARFFGRTAFDLEYAKNFSTSTPLKNFFSRAWASVNPDAVPLLADGKLETRYTTLSGGQRGGETVVLWLHNPVTAIGIELGVGKYVTDFPRGILIRGGEDCSEDPSTAAVQAPLLANFPSWQGPELRTSEQLPYFGGQADVRIPFNQPAEIRCLRIVQTGKNDQFDWSIAEIGLMLMPPPLSSS